MNSTSVRKFIRWAVLGVVFIALLGFTSATAQAEAPPQESCPQLVWKQKQTSTFVILYTASHVSLADQIEQNYAPVIAAELEKLEQAFDQSLFTPITIRLYPTEAEYYCLNAFAPTITSQDFHSHIGNREIALISATIFYHQAMWETNAVNALRHQIAVLYGEMISDGEAPPGLLQGMGGYFENPEEVFSARHQAAGGLTYPDRGWQRLLEEDIPASDHLTLLQQTSLVAFLVDVYGWDQYLAFLQRIPQVQGYRQAILDVYGSTLQDMQEDWLQYFPFYIEERWRANVIHNYDLTQFEDLIAGRAYTAAEAQLKAAMPLIELFGDEEKIAAASRLLEQAGIGVQAGALALSSRQAILSGDFQTGYENAEQSLDLFSQLGDTSRQTEIEIYRQVCEEVLILRGEVDRIKGDAAPLDPIRTEQLIRIGQRLSELGDSEGTRQVQIALMLLGIGSQEIVRWVTIGGIVVCAFLIFRRFWAALRREVSAEDLL